MLALDEAQKIPRWSETAKRLWDEDARAIKSQIDEPMVCRVFPEGKDSKGDLYEFMLGKIASAGNGQFRTPRHIIRLIASSGGCQDCAANLFGRSGRDRYNGCARDCARVGRRFAPSGHSSRRLPAEHLERDTQNP